MMESLEGSSREEVNRILENINRAKQVSLQSGQEGWSVILYMAGDTTASAHKVSP